MNVSAVSSRLQYDAKGIPEPLPVKLAEPGSASPDGKLRPLTAEDLARPRKPTPPLLVFEDDYLMQQMMASMPVNDVFAQVIKNGKVIATIDNGGGVASGGLAGVDLNGGPQGGGPAEAKWRAQQIARSVGGKVVMADTAKTPETWKPWTPPAVDPKALAAYVAQRVAEFEAEHAAAPRVDARA